MKLLLLLAAGLAAADQAPKAKHNPRNIIAVADFPQAGPNLFAKGYVFFTSHKGGSVKVHVDMTGLPQTGGPFFYHIHEKQIFNSADCDAAGKAFDPYGGLQKCPRVGDDSFCQVGDLSGKHGWINATCYQAEYTDPYVALNPQSAAYIVGRSLVFHNKDSSRFACANINIATKEQYQELFGYSDSTESDGLLEFQDGARDHVHSSPASSRPNGVSAEPSEPEGAAPGGAGPGESDQGADEPGESSPDASAPGGAEPDESASQPDESGPGKTGSDETGPDETGPEETGPDQSGPDETGPDQSGPDETGPDESGPDETEPETGPETEPDGNDSGKSGSGKVKSGKPGKSLRKAIADRKAAAVESLNSSDSNYVPAEAGAGNLFTGVVGTLLGLVLGFFF